MYYITNSTKIYEQNYLFITMHYNEPNQVLQTNNAEAQASIEAIVSQPLIINDQQQTVSKSQVLRYSPFNSVDVQVQVSIEEMVQQPLTIKNPERTVSKSQVLKYSQFDSLESVILHGKKVIVQTDKQFVACIQDICEPSKTVMDSLNSAPLTKLQFQQINYEANLHSLANTINLNSDKSLSNIRQDPSLKKLLCKCGCNRFQGQPYPICYDLQQINLLGSGIILFFLEIKALTFNVFLFSLIYAIFAMTTNLLGVIYKDNTLSSCADSYCYFHDQISHYNKQNNYFSSIQRWLGFIGTIFYLIVAQLAKHYGKQKDLLIDQHLTSASDFAIKINNLPKRDYNELELLEYLNTIWDKPPETNTIPQQNIEQRLVTRKPMRLELQQSETTIKPNNPQAEQATMHKLGIKAIQIIYNMQFSRNLIQKINDLAITINKKIKRTDDLLIIEDVDQYRQIKRNLIVTHKICADLRNRFLNDSTFRKSITEGSALIQFYQQKDKDFILDKYNSEKLNLIQKIKGLFFGKQTEIYFRGSMPQIVRAPEPSDIIWQNCEKHISFARIMVIFLATLTIIIVSLVIIAALQLSQNSSSSSSTALNLLTVVVLQIVNKLLWISLSILLELEHNHTNTIKIVSQMTKTSIALLVNIILLPILVNYIYNNKYFGGKGVAGIVFDYHITNLVIGLIFKLFDPLTFILKLGISLHFIRDYLIRARYSKKASDTKIEQNSMKNVNKLYEGPEFQIAESYVFIISNVAHAFFFAELQPFVLVLVFFQCLFFYWICKIQILKICKIPQLTEVLIFQAACQQITLLPICYAVGSIFNSFVTSKQQPSQNFQWVASTLCILLSLFSYFNPGSIMYYIGKLADYCHNKKDKQAQDDTRQIRLQNYYKESNSLSLLGFDSILKGKMNNPDIEQELKDYCQSHLLPRSLNFYFREEEQQQQRKIIIQEEQLMRIRRTVDLSANV